MDAVINFLVRYFLVQAPGIGGGDFEYQIKVIGLGSR